MNKIRVIAIAAFAVLAAACSSTTTKPSAAPAPPAAPVVASLAGVWTLTIESPMGAQDSKLTLTQAGQTLGGGIEAPAPLGNVPVKGTVTGADVKISFGVNAQGMELVIDLVGTQENAATMKGRAVFGSFGEGTFTAKKN
ncbi:MAG TPA: hypothetical protein VK629_10255 [Steroidobacteraceae bacterium]|nr:hypothetical protein [Steroidobacteraceae bacterium]